MAYTTKFSLLALLIVLTISGRVLAGREIPNKSKDVNLKQSEFLHKSFLHKHDRSSLIPGFGRVLVPTHPLKGGVPHVTIPTYGSVGAPGGGKYIPGADDTFIPNPGYEVPNPGRAGSVSALAHP